MGASQSVSSSSSITSIIDGQTSHTNDVNISEIRTLLKNAVHLKSCKKPKADCTHYMVHCTAEASLKRLLMLSDRIQVMINAPSIYSLTDDQVVEWTKIRSDLTKNLTEIQSNGCV